MKISVVMATYNGSRYILEQLESIKNQTRPVDEVIICDDRSQDNTVKIVQSFIERNNLCGWQISVNEQNLGYANNFHSGMLKTTGDIIVFSDQDDVWLPDRIEAMEKSFAENPQVQALYSEFELFYESDDVARISSPVLKAMSFDGSLTLAPFCPGNVFIKTEGCTMAVRSSFFRQVDRYWFSGFAHDEFIWKMAICTDGLYALHRATLRRRIHGDNVSTSKLHDRTKRIAFLRNLLEGHQAMLAYAESQHVSQNRIQLIQENITSTRMRLKMMEQHHLWLAIPLALRYRHCFYSVKAIPVEFLLSLRG